MVGFDAMMFDAIWCYDCAAQWCFMRPEPASAHVAHTIEFSHLIPLLIGKWTLSFGGPTLYEHHFFRSFYPGEFQVINLRKWVILWMTHHLIISSTWEWSSKNHHYYMIISLLSNILPYHFMMNHPYVLLGFLIIYDARIPYWLIRLMVKSSLSTLWRIHHWHHSPGRAVDDVLRWHTPSMY